jgi:hypothetical protein
MKKLKSVEGQVYRQVRWQVNGQIYEQIYGQVYRQVRWQVNGQIYEQIYGQVNGQVSGQVWRQVVNQDTPEFSPTQYNEVLEKLV